MTRITRKPVWLWSANFRNSALARNIEVGCVTMGGATSLPSLLCLILLSPSRSFSSKCTFRINLPILQSRNGHSMELSSQTPFSSTRPRPRRSWSTVAPDRHLSPPSPSLTCEQTHAALDAQIEVVERASDESDTCDASSSLPLSHCQIRSLPPDDRFRYRLDQLQQFYQSHGHVDVPRKFDSGLSNWVTTQRYEYRRALQQKKSLLTPARIHQLNQLQFDWKETDADGLTREWMNHYRNLKKFREEHGHVRICASEHGKMGKWLSNQRSQYQRWTGNIQPCSMTQSRIRLLEELGVVWDARATKTTKHDEKWMKRYEELCVFQRTHGHCLVPRSEGPFGRWVANQRSAFHDRLKYKVSSLTKQREDLLREIGFEFKATGDTRWERRFRELLEFYEEHGHTRVMQSQNPSLCGWIRYQRKQHKQWKAGKASTMSADRIRRLEELGMAWDGVVGRPKNGN